jgi:hypothetical protein
MWIYVPPMMSSHSAQEQAASNLGSSWQSQMLERSVTLRGKHLPARSWSRACKTKSWIRRLYGRMLPPSTATVGVDWWIASLAATRASLLAQWENSNQRTIRGTSGLTSQESSENADPDGSSLRTLQITSTRDLTSSPETCEQWVSRLKQASSARTKWAVRTTGGASSYWGTPRVGGGGGVGNVRKDTKSRLEDQIVEWDLKNKIHEILDFLASGTTGSPSFHRAQTVLISGETSSNKGRNTSRAINPNFGEWLMNWPPLWTDPRRRLDKTKFGSWETESSRLVRGMLSAYCEEGWKEEFNSEIGRQVGADMFGNPIYAE